MDGFTAFCTWTFLTCSAAFGLGHVMAAGNITQDCALKGEIVVKGKVIRCEITHQLIDGRRIKLNME